MKVVHIGDNVLSSRRFNGHDLGKYLRKSGISSDHLVWCKNHDDSHTFEIARHLKSREVLHDMLNKINTMYGTNALFYPFSYGLLFDEIFLNCDVVHLHLIHNNFFDISHLPIISRIKPVVWTLHDPWPIGGHCIHSFDCNKWITGCFDCPYLAEPFAIKFDSSAINWEYKKLIFEKCDLDLIVTSQWMFERITKTPLFNNNRLHLVHFGFDLDIFKPGDSSKAKQSLNIPDENIVISFRATEIVYKGLNSIRQCLRKLQSEYPITLLVFNERGLLDEFRDTFQIVELGWVTDDEIMIEAYNAADIFLMPSKAETFGMMAVEAMACGKPVIAMDGTSLPEVLKPDESGCIIVPQGDVDAMCSSLKLLLRDSDLRRKIGERSRTTAEKYYCKERYVNEIIEVYEKAIERKRGDKRAYQIIEQQKRNCLFKGHLSPEFSALINHDASNLPVNNVSSGEFKLIQLVRCIKKLPVIAQLWESIVRPAYNNIRDFRRKFQ